MFRWTDRIGCIRRAQVMIFCRQLPATEAAAEALRYRWPNGELAFCFDPDQMPCHEMDKLVRDIEAYEQHCLKRMRERVSGQLELEIKAGGDGVGKSA